jgi:hypothetical protein
MQGLTLINNLFEDEVMKLNIIGTAVLSLAAIFSSAGHASVITKDFSDLGIQKTASQIGWTLDAIGGVSILDFELAGFKSLDGYQNCCTDTFHLWINDTEVFTGSFNMGGGGSNKVLFNPLGGKAVTTTFNAKDKVSISKQAPKLGGVTQISLPVELLAGTNQIFFSYTGRTQSAIDEGWGINKASLTSIVVPEPSNIMLLLGGLFGMIMLRRRPAV